MKIELEDIRPVKPVLLHLPPELHARMAAMARRRALTVSAAYRLACQEWLFEHSQLRYKGGTTTSEAPHDKPGQARDRSRRSH